jgi:hypothetical protein
LNENLKFVKRRLNLQNLQTSLQIAICHLEAKKNLKSFFCSSLGANVALRSLTLKLIMPYIPMHRFAGSSKFFS